jgi:hypothetical protein
VEVSDLCALPLLHIHIYSGSIGSHELLFLHMYSRSIGPQEILFLQTHMYAAPRSDFPWPLSDREFVYRRRLVQDGAGGAIAVTKAIKASSEWLPVEKSVIRIRDFLQYTSVRPLDDGSGCSFAMLCECLGFRV